MKRFTLTLSVVLVAMMVALSSCGGQQSETTTVAPEAPEAGAAAPPAGQTAQPGAARPPAARPAGRPAEQPSSTPRQAAAPEPAPAPPPPPEPKRYVLAAGTPITVRTLGSVSTKTAQSGNEFEATLESPLVVDGHTLARKGATVMGRVVSSDQGGRVKGKASLSLSLASLHLADGRTVSLSTDSVTQVAKDATKKNVARTGIASGVGAAIGAIAGGGRGAAIGAGVGAGAGVATDLATRGPAAQIPPETVLNFSLSREVVVTEQR